jgi:glutathione S-transferase
MLQLIIGNKKYSSWSLRPWLLMKQAGIEFEEILIPLWREDTKERLRSYSPTGKVPALRVGKETIWESLAIAEYLAENHPKKKLWPQDPAARALARSVSAEMHAGFSALRRECPFHALRKPVPIPLSEGAQSDVRRIQDIWRELRTRYGNSGPFLFGEFSIADAMYAPIVFRFTRYAIEMDSNARKFSETILALPAVQEWIRAAQEEPWVIAQSEK